APSTSPEVVPPVIDLTAASTVIWLDGLPVKEAEDLVRSGTLTPAAAQHARLARRARAAGPGPAPEVDRRQ
ncbi:MAG: hypothetical protein JWL64_1714, partial [Frankiales bacterium]|nr:hypothetical protein [Frankiales bacterium]